MEQGPKKIRFPTWTANPRSYFIPQLFAVIRTVPLISFVLCCNFLPSAAAQSCGSKGIALQVLGSGGPELQDKRASSSYLIWEDGQARVLVDAGGGSALRFGESGAQMSQLDVIFFSHFHEDHSGDFSALVKSSWFEERKRPLPVYGPEGNDFMPSTVEIVYDFFGDKHGAYRYLSELLVPGEEGDYKLRPHNVAGSAKPAEAFRRGGIAAQAVRVVHGGLQSVEWTVRKGEKGIMLSRDTNGMDARLRQVAPNADL